MATRRAWMDLARETVDTFDSRDVADLYSVEWADARQVLISEHREAIEKERPGWRRELLRTSAVLHGLVRRLSPTRRLVVLVVLVGFVITFLKLVTGGWPADATWSVFTLLVCTVLLLLLLGLELVDKLRFRDELVMARQLQAELVPQTLPALRGFELGAFNRVANTVGGDLYEFQPLENGGLAILFGDASGHGMAAGLVMAVAHTAWRLQLERDPAPGEVLATLNRVLCRLAELPDARVRVSSSRAWPFSCSPTGASSPRWPGTRRSSGSARPGASSSASGGAPTRSGSSRTSPTTSRPGGWGRGSCSSSTPTGFPRRATPAAGSSGTAGSWQSSRGWRADPPATWPPPSRGRSSPSSTADP